MKEIDLQGMSFVRPVPDGTTEWYFAIDYAQGDLYEAQEIFERDGEVAGTRLFFVHYPDGEVLVPLAPAKNVAIGEPVYYDGKISFASADFAEGEVRVHQFDCLSRELSVIGRVALSSLKDCFNLRLFEHPLTLTRQGNDGTLELVWPERRVIEIGQRESFFLRDGDKLYLNTWYEDPDYRSETVVRDANTGAVMEVLPGDVQVMPNGDVWHVH